MNSEDKKKYNAEYYAKNKAKIAEKLYQKEECPICQRKVSHQNMIKHRKSSYCKARDKSKISLSDEELKELKRLLNKKQASEQYNSEQNGYDGFSEDE